MKNLEKYRQRRDFAKSPEPEGKTGKKIAKKFPLFVIQKHEARNLHYDFRLEVDGVLKSWAVPKGISLRSLEKRLAVQTEDHPMEYADFEGTIPKGEYGGGSVMIWDRGFFLNLTHEKSDLISPEKALQNGHLSFWLEGAKAKGKFTLERINDRTRSWLLIKREDSMPYQIKKTSGPRPYKIVRRDIGKTVGSSTSRAKAEASIRARHVKK